MRGVQAFQVLTIVTVWLACWRTYCETEPAEMSLWNRPTLRRPSRIWSTLWKSASAQRAFLGSPWATCRAAMDTSRSQQEGGTG